MPGLSKGSTTDEIKALLRREKLGRCMNWVQSPQPTTSIMPQPSIPFFTIIWLDKMTTLVKFADFETRDTKNYNHETKQWKPRPVFTLVLSIVGSLFGAFELIYDH